MDKIAKALDKLLTTDPIAGAAPAGQAKGGGGKSKTVKLPAKILRDNKVVSALPPKYMDRYNMLRTQVLHRTRSQGKNVLMVTSAMPNEGATLTAINLAISMAKDFNQYCLLVDTHLREPVINQYLGFKADKGLIDYLNSDTPIFDLIVYPDIKALTILPAGKPTTESTELLGSPKMLNLVQEMKERYPDRYVIFNCPPLLSFPDALVFSTYVDGVILVVEEGETKMADLNRALHLLGDTNVVGLVLNKVKEEDQS
ncbi:MAG: capsular biosynthesis protein [Proteobacteria bacterium]|nr:capsular biosynthesis protein [Pseudomonadota bacterium]MBU1611639.1 capsular biosynthesis protein [Pseudomonadota bacterium]